MAGKTTGGGRKRPPAKKKKTTTPRTRSTKSTAGRNTARYKKSSTDKTPVYILAIMVLLTVVIILLIGNYTKRNTKESVQKQESSESDNRKDNLRKEAAKENKEKTEKQDEDDKESVGREEKKTAEKDIPGKKEADLKDYYIYLVKFDQKSEKMYMQPVKRSIKSASPLSGVLNELIKGPNKSEKGKGLLSAIPDDLKIRSIQVSGNSAVLDFNDAIETNANGEILLTRIDQLVYTATQFKEIDNVIIKVNGKTKKFLGGEGLSISGPVGRRGK